jgi:uncharacterized Zn-finger protein
MKKGIIFLFFCIYHNNIGTVIIFIYSFVDPGSWERRQAWPEGEVYTENVMVSSEVQQQLFTCRRPTNPKYNSFICSDCGKTYCYKKNLLRHQRLECGKEPQFQCLYCSHKTTQKGNLLQHIKKIHPYNN